MSSIRQELNRVSQRIVLGGTVFLLLAISLWRISTERSQDRDRIQSRAAGLSELFDARLEEALQVSRSSAQLISVANVVPGDEVLLSYMERGIADNPVVSSIGINFEGAWAAANREGQPFSQTDPILFVAKGDTPGTFIRSAIPDDNLPGYWTDAFNEAVSTRRDVWTIPYFDSLGAGIYMVSYLSPIITPEDGPIGVVSTDIGYPQLSSLLREDLRQVLRGNEGELSIAIVTNAGSLLDVPVSVDEGPGFRLFELNQADAGVQLAASTVFSATSDKGFIEVDTGFLSTRLVVYDRMRDSGHVLLMSADRKAWDALPVGVLVWIFLGGIVALLVVRVGVNTLINRLTAPLASLGEAAKRVGRGEQVDDLPVDREDELGELARAMESMIQEMAERERLEAELLREQVAKQEREKFEQVFNAPTDGVVFIQDRVIVDANDAMAALLGYEDPSQLNGLGILSISAPEQADGTASKDAVEIILGRVVAGEVVESAWIAQRKDGTHVPMRITVFMGSYEGKPALLCTLKDVTELQAAIDRAEAAARTIERMSREHESFVRHELNNAIAPLLGYAEMLQRQPDMEPAKREERVGRIYEGASSLRELLTALKDLQAVERGTKDLTRKPVDLRNLLQEEVRNQETAAGGRLSIAFRAQVDDPIVHADPTFLPGVFRNLIKNAVEHVKDLPPEEHRLSVALGEVDGGLGIVVANGGSPIPENRQATFFEKFNSTKKDSGGTGLGTSYAYTVVTAHGGRISVRSSAEKGTQVRVWLPRGESSDQDSA